MAERDQKRLGRGLNTLINTAGRPGTTGTPASPVMQGRAVERIQVEKIDPNPWQPRREFPQPELDELAESIRQNGLLQPIVVRRAGDRFHIVAGERRWRACRQIGTKSIDALVVDATDRQMLEMAIVENLQRADLNPIETAQAYKRLIDEFGFTQEQVGAKVGQSRPAVANTLRLLDLPPDIREMVSRGTISAGAGRALLAVPGATEQRRLADRVVAGLATVRDLEAAASEHRADGRTGKAAKRDANLDSVAEDLQGVLGTKVEISGTQARGRVVLHYFSKEDLNRLYTVLTKGSRNIRDADLDESSDDLVV